MRLGTDNLVVVGGVLFRHAGPGQTKRLGEYIKKQRRIPRRAILRCGLKRRIIRHYFLVIGSMLAAKRLVSLAMPSEGGCCTALA